MTFIPIEPFAKDLLIIILGLALILSLIFIILLKKSIAKEKHGRIVPVLTLIMDDGSSELCAQNISKCFAKNIKIRDLDVVVEDKFKKKLTLKFEPIDSLDSDQTVYLKFRIYDENFEMMSITPENMMMHLIDTPFEAHIDYDNMENIRFSTTVIKEKDKFFIKETINLSDRP